MHIELETPLEQLIARISTAAAVDEAAERTGIPLDEIRFLIDTYCGEARAGLHLIERDLRPGMRLLEVGSGSGLLAGLLAQEGFNVVGIEPAGVGFGLMPVMFEIMKRHLDDGARFELVRKSVVDLNPNDHGMFDLVFSVNVLEHIPRIKDAFRAMAGVLAPGGLMLHTCPNYAIPYEPHFNIPLVPGMPRLTQWLFPKAVRKLPGIWEELNFITAKQVRKLAGDNGLVIKFEGSTFVASLRRIQTDELFLKRHGQVLRTASVLIERTGLLALIERMPASFFSPMTFRMQKRR